MTAPTIPAGMVPYGPEHPDYPNEPRDLAEGLAGTVLYADGGVQFPVREHWKVVSGPDRIIAYTRATPEAGTPGQGEELGPLRRKVQRVHSDAMEHDWSVDDYRAGMLATLAAPAQPASAPEWPGREAIARLIEPLAWAALGMGDTKDRNDTRAASLAKADAILALFPAQPADQRGGALREALEPFMLEFARLERDYGFDRPDHQGQCLMVALGDIKRLRAAICSATSASSGIEWTAKYDLNPWANETGGHS